VDSLGAFEDGLAVRLISTPRERIKTCHVNEDLGAVVARNRVDEFDFLPVTDEPSTHSSARIIGLVEIARFRTGIIPGGSVRRHMQPLSEENLIGADAGILAFVRDADKHRLRLVVSGREISGLVSLFDLQKLPVRAALFAIVTQLEIAMTNAIRRESGHSDNWLKRLAPDRRSQVGKEIEKSRKGDSFVDALLFTHFADKATIIRKSPKFESNKAAFKSDAFKIQFLRDQVAHAKDYALTAKAASRVCETVRLIDRWNRSLSRWPRS
jgi:hypothetical protein